MTSIKTLAPALAVAALSFLSIPSSSGSAGGGGGGGGGTVAGPCGTLTSVSAGTVTLSAGSGGYLASPLSLRGGLKNCSVYLQRYWIDFSEPSRPVSGGLNDPIVVTCTTSSSLFLNDYVSSGSSLAWSTTANITKTAVTNPASCVGAHTIRVDLRSRTDGRVLSTVFVNYTVTLK
jgi:hypothetical protein